MKKIVITIPNNLKDGRQIKTNNNKQPGHIEVSNDGRINIYLEVEDFDDIIALTQIFYKNFNNPITTITKT